LQLALNAFQLLRQFLAIELAFPEVGQNQASWAVSNASSSRFRLPSPPVFVQADD